MVETGVIYGRFQVLHLKHMEYLLAAKMCCKTLYIGITYPDDSYLGVKNADRHGIRKSDNPLTYLERYQMIHDALIDFGVQRDQFEIVPFPISHPEYITQYVPEDATFYLGICDEWGEKQNQILTNLGLTVEVLWRRTEEERGVTGTQVRAAIASDADWQSMVPKTAYEYMVRNGIDERIKKLSMLTDMAETE